MYYALAPSISIKEAQTNYLYTFTRGGHFIEHRPIISIHSLEVGTLSLVTHTTLGKFFFF